MVATAMSMIFTLLPLAGSAEDMTQLLFDVPVRVRDASPNVGSVAASCNVEFSSGADAMGMPPKVNLNTGGNLNRVFRVTVPFTQARAADVTGYRCSLVLYKSSNGSLLSGGTMIESQSGIPLDPNATQVFVVSGTL